MSSPSPTLISTTIDDLKRHAPFDAMARAHLADIATACELVYAAEGECVLSPADGPARHLYVVQRGEITGGGQGPATDRRVVLTEGECFPVWALISRRPVTLQYAATKDTFLYRVPLDAFEHAMDVSRPFREFATRRLAVLVEQSQRAMQTQYSSRMADVRNLSRSLGSLLRRAPVTVAPATPLRAVLSTMKAERIGSVVVTGEAGEPLGIFTERDVLDRVALAQVSLDTPVEQVMTRAPFALPVHADVFEAAQAMARQRFRHVLVTDAGRLAGVVSERDLFALQRLTVGEVAKAIEQAATPEALALAAATVRQFASALLAQGVASTQLTHFVTILNDAIAERALSLSGFESGESGWCWIALGSEGRMEQTLSTDQDNALIFEPPPGMPLAVAREFWLVRAQRANRILDQCGFPLCKGQIMAGNPKWCMTPGEWRDTFLGWMRGGHGEALLNAAIFFDFRPLAGARPLAEALRMWLAEHAPAHALFLRQMAQNALKVKPPLGLIRDFVVDDRDVPGTLDLKQYGARPFIDAARVYALQAGATATNTADRIRQVAAALRMSEDESGALVDAFSFVQLLRLRSQEPGEGGPALPPNRVDPETLNELDRRILKESMRQARKFQSRLDLDFQS
ncbi:MAG: CBS domain-containing protein [Betaproteobacteria bacterium]|nr:CBS domain-containing protein [Betaproteobacteria bacterium]